MESNDQSVGVITLTPDLVGLGGQPALARTLD